MTNSIRNDFLLKFENKTTCTIKNISCFRGRTPNNIIDFIAFYFKSKQTFHCLSKLFNISYLFRATKRLYHITIETNVAN